MPVLSRPLPSAQPQGRSFQNHLRLRCCWPGGSFGTGGAGRGGPVPRGYFVVGVWSADRRRAALFASVAWGLSRPLQNSWAWGPVQRWPGLGGPSSLGPVSGSFFKKTKKWKGGAGAPRLGIPLVTGTRSLCAPRASTEHPAGPSSPGSRAPFAANSICQRLLASAPSKDPGRAGALA